MHSRFLFTSKSWHVWSNYEDKYDQGHSLGTRSKQSHARVSAPTFGKNCSQPIEPAELVSCRPNNQRASFWRHPAINKYTEASDVYRPRVREHPHAAGEAVSRAGHDNPWRGLKKLTQGSF